MDSTGYYNKNSKAFYERTINADLSEEYQKFLKHLPKKARILDAGCGVGRDSKFFLDNGYEIVAFDGSLEMMKIASNLLNKKVLHMRFEDISFSGGFDAIWANASLLHVPFDDLRKTFQSFYQALLPSGILYASFKYGFSKREEEDRVFFDMDEKNIENYIKGLFQPIEIWKGEDTRSKIAPSVHKSWLHLIAKRIDEN
jgi:SAM-dependent methyltransferase